MIFAMNVCTTGPCIIPFLGLEKSHIKWISHWVNTVHAVACIFFNPFFTAVYNQEQLILDSLCTKQGNSYIISAVYNQERVILVRLKYLINEYSTCWTIAMLSSKLLSKVGAQHCNSSASILVY